MSGDWRNEGDLGAEGRDVELASALDFVDPGTRDPNYWMRFQAWVMERAAPELARRRLLPDPTMGDVLSAWARAVVPTAMLAAAVAGVLLLRGHPAPAATPASVEELLVAGLGEETIPVTLSDSDATIMVSLAGERF